MMQVDDKITRIVITPTDVGPGYIVGVHRGVRGSRTELHVAKDGYEMAEIVAGLSAEIEGQPRMPERATTTDDVHVDDVEPEDDEARPRLRASDLRNALVKLAEADHLMAWDDAATDIAKIIYEITESKESTP